MDQVLIRRMLVHDVRLRDAEGDKPPVLTGRAGVYNTEAVVANFRETIVPGAFSESLRAGDHDIYSTFNHNADNLLGRRSAGTLTLKDSDEGLDFEVSLNLDTQVGRDVAAMAKRGDIRGASIAFAVKPSWETRTEGDQDSPDPMKRMPLYTVNRGILYELGPVSDPAYKQTSVELRSDSERAKPHLERERRAQEEARRSSDLDVVDLDLDLLALRARALDTEENDAHQA